MTPATRALLRIILGFIASSIIFLSVWNIFQRYVRIPTGVPIGGYGQEIRGEADYIAEVIANGIYRCWYQTQCGKHKRSITCKKYRVFMDKGSLDESDITDALKAIGKCGLCGVEGHSGREDKWQWKYLPIFTYYWGCTANGKPCNQIPNCKFENPVGPGYPDCYGYPQINNRIIWRGRDIYAEANVNIIYEFHTDFRHRRCWGWIIIEVS